MDALSGSSCVSDTTCPEGTFKKNDGTCAACPAGARRCNRKNGEADVAAVLECNFGLVSLDDYSGCVAKLGFAMVTNDTGNFSYGIQCPEGMPACTATASSTGYLTPIADGATDYAVCPRGTIPYGFRSVMTKRRVSYFPFDAHTAIINLLSATNADDDTNQVDNSDPTKAMSDASISTYQSTTSYMCGLNDPWTRAKAIVDAECTVVAANPSIGIAGEDCEWLCAQNEFFSLETYQCEACNSDCLTCDGHANYCTSCPLGKSLKASGSIIESIECVDDSTILDSIPSPTDPCPAGYYAESRTVSPANPETADANQDYKCTACPIGCATCKLNASFQLHCSSCMPGMVLNDVDHYDVNGTTNDGAYTICSYINASAVALTTT